MAYLEEGATAPEIKGKDQDGNLISLSDFKGKKVILYFYPKDNTPGCTAEACNLRDNYDALLQKGFAIIGVSADSAKSHQNFRQKHDLPFPLLVDEDKEVIKSYGAWGEKKMYGKTYEGILRTTYVIDEEGKIEKVFPKVKTKDHTKQILDELN
ncbi:MAG TPA: thioredoxin-dependent thiol peroxidase [Bacteroidales bacterium]|nr:thioredoxin-dependent thiol peroxidase [Bacteroidales bacterium]